MEFYDKRNLRDIFNIINITIRISKFKIQIQDSYHSFKFINFNSTCFLLRIANCLKHEF